MKTIFTFFTTNWKAKIGSLVLAVLFYAYMQNSKIVVKTINIPIEYPKLYSKWSYGENLEKTIPVKLEGQKELVNFAVPFLKAIVFLSDLRIGDNDVPLRQIDGIPNGLRLTKLKSTVPVLIFEQGFKSIPVEIPLEGELATEFEKLGVSIRPNRIQAYGKQEELDKIQKITLPPISLTDKTESFSKTIKLPEPKSSEVFFRPKEVFVSVNIAEASPKGGEQTIVGIPISCVGLANELEAEFNEDTVSVKVFSNAPIKSSILVNGILAEVPCNHTYDAKRRKILPGPDNPNAKIRLTKVKELRTVEILSVKPEKVSIQYKLKEEFDVPSSVTPEPGQD